MSSVPTDRIRNVAFVGHSGAGTTSLAEALLARSGAITRAGKVDDGTSSLDTEPEAVKRKISLSLALAPFEWKASNGETYKVNVIDTPGYPDFVGEVEAAMSVADLVVVVVSAVDGVQVQTEMLWRRAAELRLPRMVFVNKEDKERADFHSVLDQLRASFGSGFLPLELPLGEADSLHGIADVLSEEAYEYEPGGTHHTEPMPADVADEEHQLHDAAIEEIVSGDDDQLERYLSGEVPSVADLETSLAQEVLACSEFPVLLGSAHTGVGVDRLADFICELGPSPADRPAGVQAGEGDAALDVQVPADATAKPLAYVFKTVTDPFVGQLSLFKVLSGTIATDQHLVNARTGADERLHAIFTMRGKDQLPVQQAVAGDIAAVAKLAHTTTGDTLAPKGSPVKVVAEAGPIAQYGVSILAATQSDDDKLGGALAKLQAEDPLLLVDRVEETHQTVLRGFGDTHIAVTLERLSRKFGVHVTTEDIRVPYRETVTGNAEAIGRVKKQTGGHGQFAVVNMRVSALPRGGGFEFVDSIVGGAIPRNYLPAVQKGLEETMTHGGHHGFPVVDVKVDCYDGKYHAVDSSEMAFKTAASQGLKEGLAAAGSVVLEPISLVQISVPNSHQGDVMGDINSRRGRVQGTDTGSNGDQVISALVPTSELGRYAIDLRSMTGGRGSFTAQHDHYDVLPSHLVDTAKATLPAAKH